jgi:hypothetical protein
MVGAPVNIREGMRRIGIVLGVLGGIGGAYYSAESYSATPKASAESYVIWIALPVLGFFIPWGTIQLLRWIISGFTQASN